MKTNQEKCNYLPFINIVENAEKISYKFKEIIISGIKTSFLSPSFFLKIILHDSFYKLYKFFYPDLTKIIPIAKVIGISDKNDFDIDQLLDKYNSNLKNFFHTMEINFPQEQLKVMYKNLRTLKIKYNSELPFGTIAAYSMTFNSIYLSLNDLDDTIYHELFHMITAKKYINYNVCGFNLMISFLNLGRAINEGYTEIMSNRFFSKNLEHSGYMYEIIFAKEIENIIGQEKMQKLYLDADLKGLIQELGKYVETKEIIDFIRNIDDILYYKKKLFSTIFEVSNINPLAKFSNAALNDQLIKVKLFLEYIKRKKVNADIKFNIGNIKKFYQVERYSYSNIYSICLDIYYKKTYTSNYDTLKNNLNLDFSDTSYLEKIINIINPNLVEDICFNGGIEVLFNELAKYVEYKSIYNYLKELNKCYNLIEDNNDSKVIINDFLLKLKICTHKSFVERNIKIKDSKNIDNIKYSKYGITNIETFVSYFHIFSIDYLDYINYKLEVDENKFWTNDEIDNQNIFSQIEKLIGKDFMIQCFINDEYELFLKELLKFFDIDIISTIMCDFCHNENSNLEKYFTMQKFNKSFNIK